MKYLEISNCSKYSRVNYNRRNDNDNIRTVSKEGWKERKDRSSKNWISNKYENLKLFVNTNVIMNMNMSMNMNIDILNKIMY